MSERTSATRYAKALIDVASQESDPNLVEQELATVVETMRQHPELRRVMTSPGIPHAARVKVVEALAEAGNAQPVVRKLLVLLADRGRLELLEHILAVYRERLLALRNVVSATVTSATPLPPEKLRALEERLGNLTGKQVQLEAEVDPSLIGGIVTRIGSTVYDGSIRTQLKKMRDALVREPQAGIA